MGERVGTLDCFYTVDTPCLMTWKQIHATACGSQCRNMSSPYNWPTTNATPVHERKVVVDVALGWSIRVETLSSHWLNIVTWKTTQDKYQNYCPHGGWKLNSPTSLDNRYNSLVVSIHYWKIHLDNSVSSNPSVANGCCCCCCQGPEWQPGGALYNYSRGIDTRWVNGLDYE